MAPITIKNFALLSALFAAIGSAVPINNNLVARGSEADNVETVTDVDWKTVQVTTTVLPTPSVSPSKVPAVHAVVATPSLPATPTTPIVPGGPGWPVTPTSSPSSSPASQPAAQAPATTSSSSSEAAAAPQATEASKETKPAGGAQSKQNAPAPAPPAGGGGGGGACSASSPCSGDGTFYDVATTPTNPSSCGVTSDGNKENVVALPHGMMKDSDCGKTVTLSYGGKSAVGKVVDKCMGCNGDSIDLSRHFFGELASMSLGRLSGVKWHFN